MIRVNLVPPEILARARQRQLLLQAAALGSVFAVIVVCVSIAHVAGRYRLENDYNYKDAKLKKLGAIVAQVEELEKASAAVRARLGVIEDLLKGRPFYPLFMSEFARTVPAGVRVTNMSTGFSPGTLKLTISAVALSNQDVAAWVRTLESNPRFGGVELGPVSGANRVYGFTLIATYTHKL